MAKNHQGYLSNRIVQWHKIEILSYTHNLSFVRLIVVIFHKLSHTQIIMALCFLVKNECAIFIVIARQKIPTLNNLNAHQRWEIIGNRDTVKKDSFMIMRMCPAHCRISNRAQRISDINHIRILFETISQSLLMFSHVVGQVRNQNIFTR